MFEFVEWVILTLQCGLLFYVANVATTLEQNQRDRHDGAVSHRHWVVHVVRDTDASCTPCAVFLRSGHLVEIDTPVHNALLKASEIHDIDALLAGTLLHDAENATQPIIEIEYTRVVHDCTRREQMQQVLDKYECDLVPIDHDAPPAFLVVQNAHAVLGIMLAQQTCISQDPVTCDSKRPATSPRQTPKRRCGEASESATARKT